MLKQIEIKGQRFELYSPDKGRTWSSNPGSLVAYGRRKKTARSKLQKSFEHIGDVQDPDPDSPAGLVDHLFGR
jgi:hypothetical protein